MDTATTHQAAIFGSVRRAPCVAGDLGLAATTAPTSYYTCFTGMRYGTTAGCDAPRLNADTLDSITPATSEG